MGRRGQNKGRNVGQRRNKGRDVGRRGVNNDDVGRGEQSKGKDIRRKGEGEQFNWGGGEGTKNKMQDEEKVTKNNI